MRNSDRQTYPIPPGIDLELTKNMAGMYPECGWNGPGVDLEWPGIWWEWTWNVAKIIILFFTWIPPGMTWNTWIPPGMTWNDLEWIKIWVWIIKLFLLGMRLEFTWIPTKFLPFHLDPPGSAWIWVECPGQGKVLDSLHHHVCPFAHSHCLNGFWGQWYVYILRFFILFSSIIPIRFVVFYCHVS